MNLQAQIELITTPQDFTRLCNAVLMAEHGADFLPIDDDRADRGNDGYLKSEKRMYAMHCFKRIQNKSLDSEIQSKMIGDLRKAISLKQAADWDIAHWTFLSNYPIPEKIGAQVFAAGQAAGIDVSWSGPAYLSEVLQRFASVRELFPNLLANDVMNKLSGITNMLASLSEDPKEVRINRIPESRPEQDLLIAQAPPAWEYLLFAGALVQGRKKIEPKWLDYQSGHGRRTGVYLDEDAAMARLKGIWDDAIGIAGGIMSVLTEEAQLNAFGALGEPGDPGRIIHMAERVVSAYEDLLDWAADIRGAVFPERMKTAASLAALVASQPAEDIRDFIDRAAREIERVPALLEQPENQPVRIQLALTLTINDAAISAFTKEAKKVFKKNGKRRFW